MLQPSIRTSLFSSLRGGPLRIIGLSLCVLTHGQASMEDQPSTTNARVDPTNVPASGDSDRALNELGTETDESRPKQSLTYCYVVIVTLVVFSALTLLCLCMRRRRRRATLARLRNQSALAQETRVPNDWRNQSSRESYRPTRFTEVGLNDNDEAPPAYMFEQPNEYVKENSKIFISEASSVPSSPIHAHSLEMSPMIKTRDENRGRSKTRDNTLQLPTYEESSQDKPAGVRLTRPARSVTPTQRPLSITSVLSHADTSAHQHA